MTTRITLSLSEYVYDEFIKDYDGDNRSKYVERLIILGAEAQINKNNESKGKLLQSYQKISDLEEKNKELSEKLTKIQEKLQKKTKKSKIIKGTDLPEGVW